MKSQCYLCLCEPPLSTFESLSQSLQNLVCMPWHLSPSQLHEYRQSVCASVGVFPSFMGKSLVKTLAWQRIHTQQKNFFFRLIIFYEACVLSKNSRGLFFSITSCVIMSRNISFNEKLYRL